MMRFVSMMMVGALLATPVMAERYKALPTARDNAEMSSRLMNGEQFLLKQFLKNPEQYHWTSFYHAAEALFKKGRKDEAVKWYYVGQIRARVAAGLDPDPSRNNAMMVAMAQGIGQPIMAYAHSDNANWVEQIDNAIAWDKEHPLPNDPKQVIGISDVAWDSANFQQVYDQIRAGLLVMRDTIAKGA